MAKIQLKSDNITPSGGLFSIFNRLNSSGLRKAIDKALGSLSSGFKAYSYSDVYAGYLCGSDCIEDVMGIKPIRNGTVAGRPDNPPPVLLPQREHRIPPRRCDTQELLST